jgi:hypothetical protein
MGSACASSPTPEMYRVDCARAQASNGPDPVLLLRYSLRSQLDRVMAAPSNERR